MRSIRTCLLIAAMVALSACGGIGPEAASPGPTTERTILLDGKPMRPCGIYRMAVCGRFRVPEDRSDPTGRRIGLDVMVIPASDPDPEPDPVFFLAGGPGGAGTEIWSNAADVFHGIHDHRDIVLVDQRGTGRSNPLLVPGFPDTGGMSAREAETTIARSVKDALTALDADPRLYTSTQAADDLDEVRSALGYERIDLYGGSYGATLAQYYLRRHERHVRAIALDGGTLLDVPLFERIAQNSQHALDAVFERCARDPICRTAFPDPAGDLAAATARLAEHPVRTDVRITGTGTPIVVDAEALVTLIHHLLLVSHGDQVPLVIHQAATGRFGAVARRIQETCEGQNLASGRLVMSLSILCSEGWARFDPDRTAESGAGSYVLGPELARSRAMALVCNTMPQASPDPGDAAPVRSSVPVLLLNGTEDPQDPPANVADAPLELPNSLALAVPGFGHTVGHLECFPDMLAAFFEAGSVAGLDTSCVASLTPPPFETD